MSRSWIPRLVVAVAVMAAIVAGGHWQASRSEAASANAVKIGWVPAASWTPWATLKDELPEGTRVELVPFKSSNDELTALSNGSIDMAPVGYNNLAALLTTSNPKVKFVSGISDHGSVFIAGKHSDIKSWQDLRGKRIGTVRGSTQYVNIATAMTSHGMSLDKDAKFVNMQGFPDLNLALKRGDLDAIVTFPPLSGDVEKAAYGQVVPAIQKDLYNGSFTVASGILAGDAFLAEHHDQAKTVLKAYYERMTKLSNDPDAWADQFDDVSGTKAAGIADALRADYIKPQVDMQMSEILKVPSVLSRMRIIDKNTSAALEAHIDYSLLEQVTGKSSANLGKDE